MDKCQQAIELLAQELQKSVQNNTGLKIVTSEEKDTVITAINILETKINNFKRRLSVFSKKDVVKFDIDELTFIGKVSKEIIKQITIATKIATVYEECNCVDKAVLSDTLAEITTLSHMVPIAIRRVFKHTM